MVYAIIIFNCVGNYAKKQPRERIYTMKKITIENTQKDAKWASKEVNVPESALECFDVYGTNDGMYTMAMSTSFPVRFRKTDGSQEAADNLFKGIFGREISVDETAQKIQAAEKLMEEASPEIRAAFEAIKAANEAKAAKKAEKKAIAKAKKASAKKTV